MNLDEVMVEQIINKLLRGEDYRDEIINAINVEFLDFALFFFKQILEAKMQDEALYLAWYKKHFISDPDITPKEAAIYAGINEKTIRNIYGCGTKEVILDVAQNNMDYLENLLHALGESENIGIHLKITHKSISVELDLNESLVVINALATKKIALRGGAWSSVGKKVEKPLLLALCQKCGVSEGFYSAKTFCKDKNLAYDREVDFKLYNADKSQEYRVEVKLMGKGNPESADAVMARESHIFVADTLSDQNKRQLKDWNIEFLELKGNKHCINDIRSILKRLHIPHKT
ncbi:CfrBI family restriction endonuclease [Helicobacter suis]|uniref:CfrBI family restriction endonuclease n=1 Tax=Helicobacter suis TaxID=104628 RepID=UPI0024903981|nr:CfrBI family restriction endonuclease [Helicobacter suis]